MLFSLTIGRRAPVLLASLLAAGLCLSGCNDKKNDDSDTQPAPSDTLTFTQAGLYPEGVQYDSKNNYFLVSSQTRGAVGMVHDDGHYMSFADDNALVSTIGMNLDDARNRLLVAVSDPGYNTARTSAATQRKMARLAIFNRNTGQLSMPVIDLAALRPTLNHFANDIAVDAQGNAYVTDSFAPIIYKVDPQGAPTVFLESQQLAAPAGSFGLNGIVFHPDGYLLVAKSDVGIIYKVSLATPSAFAAVSTTGLTLTGADGLQLTDNNTLLVVCNAQAKVYRLSSADGWRTATQSGTFGTPPQYPTTLARRGDASYVLYSNLNALQANQQPPVSVFTIQKVSF